MDKNKAKEKYLETNNSILNEMRYYAETAIDYFEKYKQGNISESTFISKMQELEPNEHELYLKSGYTICPVKEWEDYDQACQNVFAIVDNMFLYYSKTGLETCPKKNRDYLMQNEVENYYVQLERIKTSEKKIH